jgi:D-alanyl-D-alanine dipeptidase
MVVVIAPQWDSSQGWLRRFELNDRMWEQAGPTIAVVLGSNGLAWGRGMHPLPQPGREKKEGDGRSPAGIFQLPYAFGAAAPDAVREIKLPYVQCTATVECVEDPKSSEYNIMLDRRSVERPDWKSSEKMRREDGEYELGIFVAHNTDPAQPGAGSCVFLHVWRGPKASTGGGTGMSLGAIESLLGWLDPQAHPVLVQLPEPEYERLQKPWLLPPKE